MVGIIREADRDRLARWRSATGSASRRSTRGGSGSVSFGRRTFVGCGRSKRRTRVDIRSPLPAGVGGRREWSGCTAAGHTRRRRRPLRRVCAVLTTNPTQACRSLGAVPVAILRAEVPDAAVSTELRRDLCPLELRGPARGLDRRPGRGSRRYAERTRGRSGCSACGFR